ncbi:hypothetical protein AB205_0185590, partial [Aquarana catesbeiana]
MCAPYSCSDHSSQIDIHQSTWCANILAAAFWILIVFFF